MHFIDYDYVGVNYLAYDIANFLNETTIDYCTEDYPGFLSVKKITFEEISTVSRLYPGYYPKM
jgi:thiamine kinase-like enzyme